jgi:hypothetical protein
MSAGVKVNGNPLASSFIASCLNTRPFVGEFRANTPSCQPEAAFSLDMQVYCV